MNIQLIRFSSVSCSVSVEELIEFMYFCLLILSVEYDNMVKWI